MKKHYGLGSIIIIVLTLILFILALFTKGLTHDLLLEAGIFLVSVKLIIAAYVNSVNNKKIMTRLDEIKSLLVNNNTKR